MGVKVIFLMSIVFGVLLPNGDVGSDILLMINTLMFNIGNTLELSGCKICFKSQNEVYQKKKDRCVACLVNDHGECGGIRSFLNKFHELQNDVNQECKNEQHWRVKALEDDTHFGNLVPGKYDDAAWDICGIEYTKLPQNLTDELDIDRRMLINRRECRYEPHINPKIEACKVYGQASFLFCYSLMNGRTLQGRKLDAELITLLKNDGTNVGNHSSIINKLYKVKTTKKIIGNSASITDVSLEPGFHFEDGCGIYFQPHQPVVSDIFKNCQDDACLIHLNTLHIRTNKIQDLDSWYENIDYYLGARVGGRVCSLLQIYGLSILIPILMNFAANVVVFYNDITNDRVKWFEAIPLLLLVYPQWRVLRYLGSYLFFHGDETKLEQDKVAYERDVGTLEPYLEAAIQVKPLFIQFA